MVVSGAPGPRPPPGTQPASSWLCTARAWSPANTAKLWSTATLNSHTRVGPEGHTLTEATGTGPSGVTKRRRG